MLKVSPSTVDLVRPGTCSCGNHECSPFAHYTEAGGYSEVNCYCPSRAAGHSGYPEPQFCDNEEAEALSILRA